MKPQHYAVIDFETTGLSPAHGARPTEIAVVLVRGGEIVDRFQSLMNPGVRIPWDIQQFTGITDAMVRRAPPVREVMAEAVRVADGQPIVAHNAAFDRKFWEYEARDLPGGRESRFLCSLLLARRLFPGVANHKLATLVSALGLPSSGRYHRALADAECTAHLFIRLQEEVARVFGVEGCDCGLLERMQRANKRQLGKCVEGWLGDCK
ncbi:exonuclease domain-containing protein [Halomonas denitrificans]|nr:3'-5' exonuclease [Halomonas denitrificans]